MAVNATIPLIWSARITYFLDFFSAFTPNSNRQWEGDASIGNTVKIPTIDRSVQLADYSRTEDLADPEVLNTTTQDLVINQAKAFHFLLEDLDAQQNKIPPSMLLDTKSTGGAQAVAQNIDKFVSGLIRAIPLNDFNVHPASAAFNLNYMSSLRQAATLNNQSRSNLVQIVPPEIVKKIDDAAIAKTYGDIVASQLIAGSIAGDPVDQASYVGVIGGIRTYVSNDINLKASNAAGAAVADDSRGTHSIIYVFDPRDLGLVVQTNKVEVYRPEKRFASAVKGLVSYGAKVINAGRMQRYIFSD